MNVMAESESEDGHKGWKMFLRRHWAVAALFLVLAVLAVVGAVLGVTPSGGASGGHGYGIRCYRFSCCGAQRGVPIRSPVSFKTRRRRMIRAHNVYPCRGFVAVHSAADINRAPKTEPCSIWRRGRDSNPGWALTHDGFQDRCIQPLCHPSGVSEAA